MAQHANHVLALTRMVAMSDFSRLCFNKGAA